MSNKPEGEIRFSSFPSSFNANVRFSLFVLGHHCILKLQPSYKLHILFFFSPWTPLISTCDIWIVGGGRVVLFLGQVAFMSPTRLCHPVVLMELITHKILSQKRFYLYYCPLHLTPLCGIREVCEVMRKLEEVVLPLGMFTIAVEYWSHDIQKVYKPHVVLGKKDLILQQSHTEWSEEMR